MNGLKLRPGTYALIAVTLAVVVLVVAQVVLDFSPIRSDPAVADALRVVLGIFSVVVTGKLVGHDIGQSGGGANGS